MAVIDRSNWMDQDQKGSDTHSRALAQIHWFPTNYQTTLGISYTSYRVHGTYLSQWLVCRC